MRKVLSFFLLGVLLMSLRCTESCDQYKLQGDELRIIQDMQSTIYFVNETSDTLKLTLSRTLDQGPDKYRRNWVQGYRSCGAVGQMDYRNSSKAPYFRVFFNVNKQHTSNIEIPSLQVGRVFLKMNYGDSRLSLFNDQNMYTLQYNGEAEFEGKEISEVYTLTGYDQESGNTYIYSLYEGLIRLEEQGKVWKRIWP